MMDRMISLILFIIDYFQVKNPATGFCLDTIGKEEKSTIPVSVYVCQNGASTNQFFSLAKDDRLRREDTCVVSTDSEKVTLIDCKIRVQQQRWKHEQVNHY
jgi:uncharacterized Zn finger protein